MLGLVYLQYRAYQQGLHRLLEQEVFSFSIKQLTCYFKLYSLKETRSVTMNIFRKKYFLFKSFVKIEFSYVFNIFINRCDIYLDSSSIEER